MLVFVVILATTWVLVLVGVLEIVYVETLLKVFDVTVVIGFSVASITLFVLLLLVGDLMVALLTVFIVAPEIVCVVASVTVLFSDMLAASEVIFISPWFELILLCVEE